jgi:hypothetical protein
MNILGLIVNWGRSVKFESHKMEGASQPYSFSCTFSKPKWFHKKPKEDEEATENRNILINRCYDCDDCTSIWVELGKYLICEGHISDQDCAYNKIKHGSTVMSLIPLIKIFATDLMFCLADLIHWGFLDALQLSV